MSMINVTVKSNNHEFKAKMESLPSMIVACRDGKPVKSFWSDLVFVMNLDDFNPLMIPKSDFIKDITVSCKNEEWLIKNGVAYDFVPSPIGEMTVVVVRPDSIQYLS